MTEQNTFEILILYGSQTGNSEAAAKELGQKINQQLSSKRVTSTVMQADDFLEIQNAKWTTNLFIIITSSYGVGHAPLGCQKFRLFCDDILDNNNNDNANANDNNNDSDADDKLKGMKFALLGLGDSFYSTFLNNPTRIYNALKKAGGVDIIGDFGKADASGKGEDEQGKVVMRWMDDVMPLLEKEVEVIRKDDEDVIRNVIENATTCSQEICRRIFEDWDTSTTVVVESSGGFNMSFVVVVLLIAIAAGAFFASQK